MEALRVAITRKAVNTEAVPLPLEPSLDDTQPMSVDAYVVVSPLDFDLESSNVQTIIVFPNDDSAPVLFKLVAKSEGRKTIAVEFFQNTRYLGRAELETIVSQQVQVPHLVSALAVLEVSATQSCPDLTILFDRVPVGNDRHYYRYRLLSPIRELNLWFDEFHSPETSVMPQGFLEETFTQLNRLLSSDSPGDFFFGRLNSIGMNLYRRLFSDDFKRLYWNSLRYKVKSIVIISFEPWIPWELVRPFNPETNEADDGFLCEKFNLTRWLAGAGFPDTMSLEQLGLIISASDLDSARLEAEEIKRLLGSKVRDILSSGPSVYHLLRTNDFSGLHFACHGSFNKDNPDMSTLFLEDGTWLSPIDIDGDGLAFGKNKPLVFLNACETGQGGYALTGMGGWAEAFVGRAKCSGFIGSIWKANDESACKFAVAFYCNLLDGKTVAEAAKLARLSIKQAGDPTWLSYTVYANPLAHLVINRSRWRTPS
jgi:CHAT domain